MLTILLTLLIGAETLEYKKLQTFETDGDEIDVMTISDFTYINDRLWGLDITADCLHIWEKDGKYLRQVGQRGEGPGEFIFDKSGRSIFYDGEHVVTLDKLKRLTYFDKDGELVKVERLPNELDLVRDFKNSVNGYLMNYSQAQSRDSKYREFQKLSLVTITGSPIVDYFVGPDKAFTRTENGGWRYNPWRSRLVFYQDKQKLYVALSRDPEIRVYDYETGEKQVFKVPLEGPDLNEEDYKRQRRLFQRRASPGDELVTPKKDGVIDKILILSDQKTIFPARYRPAEGSFYGVCIDKQTGEVITRASLIFGESTRIKQNGNQTLLLEESDSGELSISLISISLNEARQ